MASVAQDAPGEKVGQPETALATRLQAIGRLANSRVLGLIVRLRWPLLLALTAVVVALDGGQEPIDVPLFIRASDVLLSRDWANAFADSTVQVGPLLLLLFGIATRAGRLVGLSSDGGPSLLIQAGGLLALLHLVRRGCRELLPGAATGPRELLAGLVAIGLDIPSVSFETGHPNELLVAVLWSHVALDVRTNRTPRAVVCIVIAAALVTQGALGIALLFARSGSLRRSVPAAAAAVLGSAACYLPFSLFGEVNTAQYTWPIDPRSTMAPFFGVGAPFTWTDRLFQAAAAGCVGLLFARLVRSHPVGVWLVPLVMVATRVALDPKVSGQYWVGAHALFVVAICLIGLPGGRRLLPAYVGAYAGVLSLSWVPAIPGTLVLLGCGWTGWLLRPAPRNRPSTHSASSESAAEPA